MKRVLSVFGALGLFVFLGIVGGGWNTAFSREGGGTPPPPKKAPSVLYVADFEIDSDDVKSDPGVLGNRSGRRLGVLNREGPLQRSKDPEITAPKLRNLLSESLVQDLAARSLTAVRLPSGRPLPREGWLIRGEFLEVDQGNRVKRAVIGFGTGATDMHVESTVTDLGGDTRQPFLVIGVGAGSGKSPGAVVTMNPYAAAAKFVVSKHASEKDVRNVASGITSEILQYMKNNGLISARP